MSVADARNAAVAATGLRMRCAARHVLFLEGDPIGTVYRMVDGAVMLYKLLPDGRRQIVEIVGAGDVLGLAWHDQHDCSAETLAPAVLLAYDRAAVRRSPGLQLELASTLGARLVVLHEHLVLLGRKSALERVASFLVRCLPRREVQSMSAAAGAPRAASICLRMTRQEIADYLGLTLETVSRSFSELRRRGLVTLEKSDVLRIDDMGGVSRLAG